MKPTRQRIVIITVTTIVSLHLLLVGLGALGTQLPAWLRPAVNDYTYPLFPQPWSKSSTNFPTSDAQLEFRSCTTNHWSEWQDASTAFHYNDNSVAERIEQGINNELRWQILNNLYSADGQRQFDHILESSTYAKALYYVLRMHRYHQTDLPDTLQLRMSLRFTPEIGKAYTFQRTQLEFPKYEVPK